MGRIAVSEEAVSHETQQLISGLDEYCSMTLEREGGLSDAPGAVDHDSIASSLENVLSTWKDILQKDAQNIELAAKSFADNDEALAASWQCLGV